MKILFWFCFAWILMLFTAVGCWVSAKNSRRAMISALNEKALACATLADLRGQLSDLRRENERLTIKSADADRLGKVRGEWVAMRSERDELKIKLSEAELARDDLQTLVSELRSERYEIINSCDDLQMLVSELRYERDKAVEARDEAVTAHDEIAAQMELDSIRNILAKQIAGRLAKHTPNYPVFGDLKFNKTCCPPQTAI